MAKTVFDKILDTTTGPKSYNYFKNQVDKITSPGARALINQGKATIRPRYGVMNLFGYDPKLKQVLPLYDRFPLIFPIEPAKGGFYGINFHYLQPGARVAFLRQLSRFATDKNYDKNTRYNIGELSGRYFKKTIKRYLFSQVRTSFLNITADEMAIAIFLPVARFEKGQPY
tara:strand:+ start:162 stop:674 length:513 start_codon:yes stop_codon:yes gene_type:complete